MIYLEQLSISRALLKTFGKLYIALKNSKEDIKKTFFFKTRPMYKCEVEVKQKCLRKQNNYI